MKPHTHRSPGLGARALPLSGLDWYSRTLKIELTEAGGAQDNARSILGSPEEAWR